MTQYKYSGRVNFSKDPAAPEYHHIETTFSLSIEDREDKAGAPIRCILYKNHFVTDITNGEEVSFVKFSKDDPLSYDLLDMCIAGNNEELDNYSQGAVQYHATTKTRIARWEADRPNIMACDILANGAKDRAFGYWNTGVSGTDDKTTEHYECGILPKAPADIYKFMLMSVGRSCRLDAAKKIAAENGIQLNSDVEINTTKLTNGDIIDLSLVGGWNRLSADLDPHGNPDPMLQELLTAYPKRFSVVGGEFCEGGTPKALLVHHIGNLPGSMHLVCAGAGAPDVEEVA